MFIVNVTDDLPLGNHLIWWSNFIKYCDDIAPKEFEGYRRVMDGELKKFNCIDRLYTPFLEFETEEDAVAFILRWS